MLAILRRGKALAVSPAQPFLRLGDQHDGIGLDSIASRAICAICSGPERRVGGRSHARYGLRVISA